MHMSRRQSVVMPILREESVLAEYPRTLRSNALCDLISAYNTKLNIPHTLKEFGIDEAEFKEKVATIAVNAVGDACTGSNPRSITPEQMEKLFTCTYYGTEVDF